MKILLAFPRLLKMYIVIFVHWVFVCKLIHVNLKPCFQVSVLCIFGSARDSCYDMILNFTLCERER